MSVRKKKGEIKDSRSKKFWSSNFKESKTVSINEFTEAVMKKYGKYDKKILGAMCRFLIPAASSDKTKEIKMSDFDKFTARFGSLPHCIRNAKQVFFEKKSNGEYSIVPWYHGHLPESKKKILANPGKFLLREPSNRAVWDVFTVEYSKTFKKEGKTVLARNKKQLRLKVKKLEGGDVNILYVWTNRENKKLAHADINVAIKQMTKNRVSIESFMWDQLENQSVYQAACNVYYAAGGEDDDGY
mmetsp:Transcript_16963/g.25458  ORF Transcript_16963/g.25458 Transcript_16963/m.25458 type:complete len:243 (+) Transcript_16963:98-826(+)